MDLTPGKKDLPMEARLLLAFLLMGLVLFLTPYFYKPSPAPKPAPKPAAETAQQANPAAATPSVATAPKPAPAEMPGAVQAAKEDRFVVETNQYHVEFSNKGAVVRSWILKEYKDNAGKPLQLVNPLALTHVPAPFALEFKDQKPATDPNGALFVGKPAPDGLGIDYEFSDGRAVTKKSFHFLKNSYLVAVTSEVLQSGAALPHMLTWRGGFGDFTVPNPSAVERSVYYDLSANKLQAKVATDAKNGPLSASGTYSFLGLEDNYFAAVFLPRHNGPEAITTFDDPFPLTEGAKPDPHVGVGVGGNGTNTFSLFVGPKDIDILRAVDTKLTQMIDWGFFGIIAEPLFVALNWTNDHVVHNFGWSIVLVTVVINMVLLPLKLTSMKSAKKMQALQPQIAALNAKYKNIGIRDPRKAEQNQEMMDLYKKHGVNPLGGCLPMALQIPFFFAFYKVLMVAIELRGANWLWVGDLSRPEELAIRILPILLIVTQFISQKMTPNTSMDPSQQKIMMLMPLGLGFMFYYQSAGLVLYWLTGNVVGIVQQWFTNRMTPAPVVETPKPVQKKKGTRN